MVPRPQMRLDVHGRGDRCGGGPGRGARGLAAMQEGQMGRGRILFVAAREGAFDHLDEAGITLVLLFNPPFLGLADAKPLQRGVGIGREMEAIGRVDRIGISGVLEDLHPLHAAADGAGIEGAFYAGVGMFLAGDDGLSELLMGVAPAINGADADLEMLSEFLVGGAEAAEVAGLIGEVGFVDHKAADSAGGLRVESTVRMGVCVGMS